MLQMLFAVLLKDILCLKRRRYFTRSVIAFCYIFANTYAEKYNKNVSYAEYLEQAFARAVPSAGTDGVILVFGSLSYLAKAKEGMRKYVDWKERI